MQQKKLLLNILVSILAAAALVVGYYFFFSGSDTAGTASLSGGPNAEGTNVLSAETSEFLILLESLQTVDLDGRIFENRIFASDLVNFTTPIATLPQGRANPFAPFGVGNLSLRDVEPSTPDTGGDTGNSTEAGAENNPGA
ncbi:MAG: hypothetical protein QG665_188 [Patescibacteria group bacterium]|nr:hypothetical protein [Patescibacteria group bacterium]